MQLNSMEIEVEAAEAPPPLPPKKGKYVFLDRWDLLNLFHFITASVILILFIYYYCIYSYFVNSLLFLYLSFHFNLIF